MAILNALSGSTIGKSMQVNVDIIGGVKYDSTTGRYDGLAVETGSFGDSYDTKNSLSSSFGSDAGTIIQALNHLKATQTAAASSGTNNEVQITDNEGGFASDTAFTYASNALAVDGNITAAGAATWSTAAGALVIDGADGLTLDSDGTDAVNLGTEAVAKTITIGNDASTLVDINAILIELDSVGEINLDCTTVDVNGALDVSGDAALNGALDVSGLSTLGAETSVTVAADGLTTINNVTDASAIGTAALVVDGGVGVAKDMWLGNDLKMDSDAAAIHFGDDQDVTLTHVADTGLLLNSDMQLQFRDSSEYINSDADGYINVRGATGVDLNIAGTDIVSVTSAGAAVTGVGTFSGVLTTDDTTEASAIGTAALVCDGGASVAKDLYVGDDVMLLSDAAVLNFGADKDVSLTHVADTGLLLNSTMAIQFNDASQYIKASSAADLDLAATTDINLDCTTVDVNAALDVSGEATLASALTVAGTTTVMSVAADVSQAWEDIPSFMIQGTDAGGNVTNFRLMVSGGILRAAQGT